MHIGGVFAAVGRTSERRSRADSEADNHDGFSCGVLPPEAPATLSSLGFIADKGSAVYIHENEDPQAYAVEVLNPAWGGWDGDESGELRFSRPLDDEHRIFLYYSMGEKVYSVTVYNSFGSGASFQYFAETGEHVDEWCGNEAMTVEEYYRNVYKDPAIENVYLHSVELAERYVRDTFGMSVDELCVLPGE